MPHAENLDLPLIIGQQANLEKVNRALTKAISGYNQILRSTLCIKGDFRDASAEWLSNQRDILTDVLAMNQQALNIQPENLREKP